MTIGELLDGKIIDAPPMRQVVTFKRAPKAKRGKDVHQPEIDFEGIESDDE